MPNGEIFYSLAEAKVLIEAWRRHYNAVRPHSSLGYRPPTPETTSPPLPPSGSASLLLPAAMAAEADLIPGNWSEFREKFPVRFGWRRTREMGLQLRNKTPKRKVKAKLRDDRAPASAPNECWSMDFLSDQLFDGR
jgi:transposase InsO family protein